MAGMFAKKRKPRRSKFDDAMLDLIEEIIYDHYLTRAALTVNECYSILTELYQNRQMTGKCVSRAQFYEICDSIDEIEALLARKGTEAARQATELTKEKNLGRFSTAIR